MHWTQLKRSGALKSQHGCRRHSIKRTVTVHYCIYIWKRCTTSDGCKRNWNSWTKEQQQPQIWKNNGCLGNMYFVCETFTVVKQQSVSMVSWQLTQLIQNHAQLELQWPGLFHQKSCPMDVGWDCYPTLQLGNLSIKVRRPCTGTALRGVIFQGGYRPVSEIPSPATLVVSSHIANHWVCLLYAW